MARRQDDPQRVLHQVDPLEPVVGRGRPLGVLVADDEVDVAEPERAGARPRAPARWSARARPGGARRSAATAGASRVRSALGKAATCTSPVTSAAAADSSADAASSSARIASVRATSRAAGLGQPHPAAVAVEQRDAGLALQRGELLRDGGRREGERAGGGRDRAAAGDLAQDAHAAHVERAEGGAGWATAIVSSSLRQRGSRPSLVLTTTAVRPWSRARPPRASPSPPPSCSGAPPSRRSAPRWSTSAPATCRCCACSSPPSRSARSRAARGVRLPARRDVPAIAAVGFAGMTAYQLLLNAGERTVPAGTASLLVNLSPVFTAVAASVLLDERMTAPALDRRRRRVRRGVADRGRRPRRDRAASAARCSCSAPRSPRPRSSSARSRCCGATAASS